MENTMSLIVSIGFYLLFVVAEWRIFDKAGEAGWKSIIPIYNVIVELGFTWRVGSALIQLLVGSILVGVGSVLSDGIVGLILIVVGGLLTLAFYVRGSYYLAKSFGHGVGFTIGLILLPNIFTLILGFGESEYYGNGYDLSR